MILNYLTSSTPKALLPTYRTARAPKGEVNNIDKTAMARISSPEATPAARGIEPIVACTVALGMNETTQNSFSFKLNSAPHK
jgi:hypothetical protein